MFVSYASEDREAVARPLATFLRNVGLRVWYDQMELRVGDRLRRRIDDGLARCSFGVVILSESFFAKHYPESELDGLAQREHDGHDLILPVWHDVDVEAVRRNSPRLADRVALKWQDGLGTVATKLLEVIAPERLPNAIDLQDSVSRLQIPQITTGAELATLLATSGWLLVSDELRGEDVALVGGFQQELTDWAAIWSELGPLQQAEAANSLRENLESLQDAGWTVYGRIERRQILLQGQLVGKWPWAVLVTVRGEAQGVMHLMGDHIVIVREDGTRRNVPQ